MTITIPAQTILMDTPSGIDPVWYDKLKALFDQTNTASGVSLEAISLSGAASYSSTASWAGFSHVRIIASNISASSASANIPLIQYHANGAYQTTGYVSGASILPFNATPTWAASATTTTAIAIYGGGVIDTTNVPSGVTIDATIYNVNSTIIPKYTKASSAVWTGTTAFTGEATGIWTGGNFAIDGFKLFLSGGANLIAGKVQVYGML